MSSHLALLGILPITVALPPLPPVVLLRPSDRRRPGPLGVREYESKRQLKSFLVLFFFVCQSVFFWPERLRRALGPPVS